MGAISSNTVKQVKIDIDVKDTQTAALKAFAENFISRDKDVKAKDTLSIKGKDVLLNNSTVKIREVFNIDEKVSDSPFLKAYNLYKKLSNGMEKYSSLTRSERKPFREEIKELRIKINQAENAYKAIGKFDDYLPGYYRQFNSTSFAEERVLLENRYFEEGYKVHISLKDEKEYAYAVDKLLPELKSLDVLHKIVDIEQLGDLNSSSQQGKGITLYLDNLFTLNRLSEEVKDFLKVDNGLNVLTDQHLGGKVYARYTGYFDDNVFDWMNGRIPIPREEGYYKPDTIPEPPSLNDIFEGNIPDDVRAYTSIWVYGDESFFRGSSWEFHIPIDSKETFDYVLENVCPSLAYHNVAHYIVPYGHAEDTQLNAGITFFPYDVNDLDSILSINETREFLLNNSDFLSNRYIDFECSMFGRIYNGDLNYGEDGLIPALQPDDPYPDNRPEYVDDLESIKEVINKYKEGNFDEQEVSEIWSIKDTLETRRRYG